MRASNGTRVQRTWNSVNHTAERSFIAQSQKQKSGWHHIHILNYKMCTNNFKLKGRCDQDLILRHMFLYLLWNTGQWYNFQDIKITHVALIALYFFETYIINVFRCLKRVCLSIFYAVSGHNTNNEVGHVSSSVLWLFYFLHNFGDQMASFRMADEISRISRHLQS